MFFPQVIWAKTAKTAKTFFNIKNSVPKGSPGMQAPPKC